MSETGTDIKVRKGSGGGKPSELPPGPIIEQRPSAVELPAKASAKTEAFSFLGKEITLHLPPDHPLSSLFGEAKEARDWLSFSCRLLEAAFDPLTRAPQWALVEHRLKRRSVLQRSLVPIHDCVISTPLESDEPSRS